MTIDLPQARELLARAVATQGPDFVYDPGGHGDCIYVPIQDFLDHTYGDEEIENLEFVDSLDALGDDSPKKKTGCLVGVALDLAGEVRHRYSQQSIKNIAEDHPDMMTKEAAEYFQEAQTSQDNGSTWGEALAWAESSVAESPVGTQGSVELK